MKSAHLIEMLLGSITKCHGCHVEGGRHEFGHLDDSVSKAMTLTFEEYIFDMNIYFVCNQLISKRIISNLH